MSERSPRRTRSTNGADAGSATPPVAVAAWRKRIYRIPVVGTIFYVIWPPRAKMGRIRQALSWTAAVVAILGVGMAAYPVAGDKYPFFYKVPVEKLIEWMNFLSDMETNRIQDRLEDEFLALGDPRLAKDGDPLTRIEIPAIGLDTIVVQGTSLRALAAGAGHYESTPLPGEKGNVGIAGHRTTHGRPFNRIDVLKTGNRIILSTPIGRYTYRVQRPPWITDPYDWSIVGKSSEHLLTLSACHPKGSARQRIVVRAKLVDTEPLVRRKAA